MSLHKKKRYVSLLTVCKILHVTVLILLSTVLLIIGFLSLPQFFGIQPFCVTSGSMEPVIPTGSLIYVKESEDHYKADDIVTYLLNKDGTTATHRIVSIDGDGLYHTKGDANQTEDARPVSEENIVGKVILQIPQLGILASLFSGTKGKAGLLLFTMILYGLSELTAVSGHRLYDEKEGE